ncbi:MAG: hypothetical protein HY290_23915 [Planctomycetia bacterium]|nr:hypothetical protein [Planctomycetia bacterium]
MQIRPLVPWGLALFVSAGCQSYYPNGYGHHGPYSNFPTGPYVPPVTTTPGSSGTGLKSPTPVGGQRNLQNSESETSADGTRKVPDPRGAPGDLGAPATREESDSIKRGSTSNRGNSGSTTATPDKDPADDLDDSLSSIDDDRFASPVEYRGSPGDRELKEPRRIAAKTAPDPCKKDPNGYSWLRGVVSRDSKSGSWRITYSRNAQEAVLPRRTDDAASEAQRSVVAALIRRWPARPSGSQCGTTGCA